MEYSILFERLEEDESLPEGYYYAHIPALDLCTHGLGIDGAKKAILDLAKLWIEEKRANGERVPVELESYFTKIEIDHALFSQ